MSHRTAPLEFHFYCNSVPFIEDTFELKKSLGGSESALIFLARGLRQRGHEVLVFTNMGIPEEDKQGFMALDTHGVRWLDHASMESVIRSRQPDVFVSLRMPGAFGWNVIQDCKLRISWCEDLLTDAPGYFGETWQTDLHAFVSDYHLEQYCRTIPSIRPQSWSTVNPVDIDWIEQCSQGVEKDPDQVIYVSRPERGLVAGNRFPLLEVLMKLRKNRPDLKLKVCRYHSMYENRPQVAAVCQKADFAVSEFEGVEWLGELAKPDLYREMARSMLVLYPGVPDFAETNCIAATEAQAVGTPMVATRIGAIPETLHPGAGRLIDGDCLTKEYQQAFCDVCEGLLDDPAAYEDAQRAGFEHARRYDLKVVAEEWESYILDYFDARFETSIPKVMDRAIWHDDYRAAHYLAENHGDGLDLTAFETFEASLGVDTPEQYAEHAIDPVVEWQNNGRLPPIEAIITNLMDEEKRGKILKVLDFAGGNGTISGVLLRCFPNAKVTLVDFSETLCETARGFVDGLDDGKHKGRFETVVGSLEDIRGGSFDFVFAGEIAEHHEYPERFLAELEKKAKKNRWVLCTVPQGPFGSIMHSNSLDWSEHSKTHEFAFEARDILEIIDKHPGKDLAFLEMPPTPRGELCGHFIFHWRRTSAAPLGEVDMDRKVRRARPRERLAVCMIVRNAAADIVRCLQTVDAIADEIWIADTGSTDNTMEVAERFTRNGGEVWSIGKCPDAPDHLPDPGDFGWARNQSVSKATADWILWIDADEMLEKAANIHVYLTDNAFNGYVIRQCHMMKDALYPEAKEDNRPFIFDRPIRLFRREPRGDQAGMTYQCYAAIHEHFQAGVNDLIEPVLAIDNADIIHMGYINENIRRHKCETRNLPLLAYDREKFPDREIGPLLECREAVNLAKWERGKLIDQTGNESPQIVEWRSELLKGLGVLSEKFFDPEGKFWDAAWTVYQDTVVLLQIGRPLPIPFPAEGGFRPRQAAFHDWEHYARFLQGMAVRARSLADRPAVTWAEGEEPAMVVTEVKADPVAESAEDAPALPAPEEDEKPTVGATHSPTSISMDGQKVAAHTADPTMAMGRANQRPKGTAHGDST